MTLYIGEVSKHHDTDHTSDEQLDVGDGVQTVFTGRSENYPIVFGTVQIEFTTTSGTFQVTEVGGTFTHAELNSGSIDEDGNYSFDFVNPLTDTTPLKILQYSTKGFLTKLLELISVEPTEDLIGTGNGAQTTFNFTLTGAGAIEPGNVRLRFIINGVEYDLWDTPASPTAGSWIHNLISSSTINYTTRVIQVVFTQAPDNLTPVDGWSVPAGESWVQMVNQPVTDASGVQEPDGDGQKEVVLYNSGISNKEEIIIGLREFSLPASDIFGLELALGNRWTYEDDNNPYFWHTTNVAAFPYLSTYNTTLNCANNSQKFIYSNDSMKYWVNVTKSRVIIVIRNTGAIFTHCYFGDTIKFATPTQYKRPYVVCGNTISTSVAFTSSQVFGLGRPSSNCWRFFDENNEYKLATSGSVIFQEITTTYNQFQNTGLLKRTLKNDVGLSRVVCANRGVTNDRQNTARLYFALDGVWICPDNDMDSENTINALNVVCFQDVFRTTYQDYIAITTL